MGVGPHCAHVEPDVLTEPLDYIAQVHAGCGFSVNLSRWKGLHQTFGHDAKMAAVLEGSFHTDEVFLILGIGIIEFP